MPGLFDPMGSALLVTVEGSLVFLLITGGSKVLLSQKLVRVATHPSFVAGWMTAAPLPVEARVGHRTAGQAPPS